MKKALCLITFILSTYGITAYAANLTDGEISEILLQINEGEIDTAQIASKKAQNDQVKQFAKNMVDEHKNNIKETKKVIKDKKIKTRESAMSESFEDEAKALNKDLKKSDKAVFDKAYLNQQVMMHEKALRTLNEVLIPNAQDSEFRMHLEKTRDAVATHLEHAKTLNARF